MPKTTTSLLTWIMSAKFLRHITTTKIDPSASTPMKFMEDMEMTTAKICRRREHQARAPMKLPMMKKRNSPQLYREEILRFYLS